MTPEYPSTILVVDDDLAGRDSLRWLLQREGYAVATATNGAEALTQLRRGLRPCLIVLDLAMPIMDGLQFRHVQAQDPDLAAIPVVIFSDPVGPRTVSELTGVIGYVRKPQGVEALLKVVETYCGSHHASH